MEMWWLAPPDMHAAASPAGAVWGLVSLPLTPLCGHWCYRTSLSLLGFILRMPVTLSLLWCYRTPSLSLPLSPLHPTDGGNATLVCGAVLRTALPYRYRSPHRYALLVLTHCCCILRMHCPASCGCSPSGPVRALTPSPLAIPSTEPFSQDVMRELTLRVAPALCHLHQGHVCLLWPREGACSWC